MPKLPETGDLELIRALGLDVVAPKRTKERELLDKLRGKVSATVIVSRYEIACWFALKKDIIDEHAKPPKGRPWATALNWASRARIQEIRDAVTYVENRRIAVLGEQVRAAQPLRLLEDEELEPIASERLL